MELWGETNIIWTSRWYLLFLACYLPLSWILWRQNQRSCFLLWGLETAKPDLSPAQFHKYLKPSCNKTSANLRLATHLGYFLQTNCLSKYTVLSQNCLNRLQMSTIINTCMQRDYKETVLDAITCAFHGCKQLHAIVCKWSSQILWKCKWNLRAVAHCYMYWETIQGRCMLWARNSDAFYTIVLLTDFVNRTTLLLIRNLILVQIH